MHHVLGVVCRPSCVVCVLHVAWGVGCGDTVVRCLQWPYTHESKAPPCCTRAYAAPPPPVIEYVFGLPIVRRAYVAATGECVYHVRGVVSPECGGVFVVCGGFFFFWGGGSLRCGLYTPQ